MVSDSWYQLTEERDHRLAIQNSAGLCRVVTSDRALYRDGYREMTRIYDELRACGRYSRLRPPDTHAVALLPTPGGCARLSRCTSASPSDSRGHR
jgi:hypothetical protein